MKSPITGGNATLKSERAELVFRNEKFSYVYRYYECDDTKEQFTTAELDEVNIKQVYNQYRVKYNIPFPDEIKRIRQRYGLPAIKMSRILGWGDNQYRLYENGDVPSEANGKTLAMIMDPKVFNGYVEKSRNQFGEAEYERIMDKIKAVRTDEYGVFEHLYIYNGYTCGISNGYATQSVSRLKNIMLFYIEKFGSVFFTMMNKLLFYTDFVCYRETGRAMSGLAYRAIQYGPVPVNYNRAYSISDIQSNIVHFGSGKDGQSFTSELSPDLSAFTDKELAIMESVYERFRNITSAGISVISHEEDAWKNHQNKAELIDFNEAFSLKAL